MGGSQSKNNSDTINWNKLKTENISSSIPNLNSLSKDAQSLIASLNIPAITESQTSEFTVSHILDKISTNLNQDDQKKFNQILDQVSSQTAGEEELSATSPFISSEMYNYLVKNNETQNGGGKKKSHKKSTRKIKSKKGGSKLDNDSSTSTTSSDSSMEELLESTEEEIKRKKDKKNKNNKNNKNKDSESELSGGELSYLSSSAHTDGEYSDSHTGKKSSSESSTTQKSVESSSVTQKSVESSSVTQSSERKSTVTDHNAMQSTSISVNTEDINMVSDY
jgi:hypothetical protein